MWYIKNKCRETETPEAGLEERQDAGCWLGMHETLVKATALENHHRLNDRAQDWLEKQAGICPLIPKIKKQKQLYPRENFFFAVVFL